MKKILLLSMLLTGFAALPMPQDQNALFISKPQETMNYSILVLYKITPQFLSLSREKRGEVFEKTVIPIIQKFAGKLEVRMFDSEAFHANNSDFLFISCNDLKDYYYFIEHLRDTELFGKPYIELQDIIIGIEGGFSEYESENYPK